MPLAATLSRFHTPGPERVGLILRNGEIVELNNISGAPDNSFGVAPEEMIRYEGEAVATWHTHPSGTAAISTEDYLGFRMWPDLLHLIVGTDGVRGYTVKRNAVIQDASQDHPAWALEGFSPA